MNAIRVDNVRGEKIGHISRINAAKLARFMDARTLLVEGQTAGPKDYYDCPLTLKLYGSSDPTRRDPLKEEMRQAKLPITEFLRREREEQRRQKEEAARQKALLKAAKKGGAGAPNGSGGFSIHGTGTYAGSSTQGEGQNRSLEEIMKESERFNPRNVERAVEHFGSREEDLSKMPFVEQPEAIQTKMLPYQLQVSKSFWTEKRKSLIPARAWRGCCKRRVPFSRRMVQMRLYNSGNDMTATRKSSRTWLQISHSLTNFPILPVAAF
jgi:SWI/SNF-related matrix-associated actin-dependent regulator of chromatin subfamily A3